MREGCHDVHGCHKLKSENRTETGAKARMNIKTLMDADPVRRKAIRQLDMPEFSPMDPPDAYAPPSKVDIPYEEMPKFLQKLMDDHKSIQIALSSFEETLIQLREKGLKPDKDVDEGLRNFFSFLDDQVLSHQQKEERILFPLLHKRLLEDGEHSEKQPPTTGIDILEDDHVKLTQLSAVTFNLLGLAARLPDVRSRTMVLDAALEQGNNFVEMLRLHMFREETIVFPLASIHLRDNELMDVG